MFSGADMRPYISIPRKMRGVGKNGGKSERSFVHNNFIAIFAGTKNKKMMKMKKRKKKKAVALLGKILIDLGKLTFATMVLGSVLNSGINQIYLLLFGSISCVMLILAGILLTIKD